MEDYTLEQCPKCGGEDILDQTCLDCGINLEGWGSIELPTHDLDAPVLPRIHEWIDSLGVPTYYDELEADE